MPSQTGVTRRSLLASAAGLAVLGPGFLSGCHRSGGTDDAGGSPVTLPTHQPNTEITPELKGSAQGVPNGFLRYPEHPIKVSDAKPGTGGAVTALLSSYAVTPIPGPKNTYLTGLNDCVGADLDLRVVPASDYKTKLAVTVSGSDFPDLVEMPPAQPQLPQLLAGTCADLSDILAGDAVKDFPNLAAFTPEMWRTTIFGNRIFGIPVPRPVQSAVPFVRSDRFTKLGLSLAPHSWDEFTELCAALTNVKQSAYALSLAPVDYLVGTLGGGNGWVLDGDNFVRVHETEQYRQAIQQSADLNRQGYIHPDAFAANATVLGKQRLISGHISIHPDGYSAWGSLARFLPTGHQEIIGGLSVTGFDGAEPTYAIGAGSSNFTVIKNGDPKRAREIVSILNYLAAPFGSAEYKFRKFGVEGKHHTMSQGNPVLTQRGTDEITPVTEALDYHLADGVKVAYEGDLIEITKRKHSFALAAEPFYVKDPTIGLYSETLSRTDGSFQTKINDAKNGIISGRSQIAALDDVLKTWNSGDGRKIKKELAEARNKQKESQ